MARVRAQWAARAGVELALSRAEFDAQNPDSSNAYSLFDDLASRGEGRLADSAFRLAYSDARGTHIGVQDAHAKLNLNLMSAAQLAAIPNMPEDGPDSIADWRDADDDNLETDLWQRPRRSTRHALAAKRTSPHGKGQAVQRTDQRP